VAEKISPEISWRIIALVICIQILAVGCGVRWFLTHTNLLVNYSDWVATKSLLYSPSYDLTTYLNYPPAVAEDALNLSAWRGYHGMLTADSFNWSELTFKFQPSDHGYIYVIFDYSETTFNALRISFNPLYRSGLIKAKYSGEFISQEPIPALPFTESRWQTFKLRRADSSKAEYGLWINDTFVTNFKATPSAATAATQIGFRGGQKPVLIDSVKILDTNRKLVFSENFDHQEHFWFIFGLSTATLLAVNRIFFLLLRERPAILKTCFQFLFVISFCIFIMGSIALLLEKPLRNRYPDFGHWWFLFLKGPTNTADAYLSNKIEWIFEKYPMEKPAHTKRVIVLGSSQIDGEGISKFQEDVSSQLQRLLSEKLTTPDKNWEVIAAGVSGHTADNLLEPFKYQWLKLQPDLVIVNLSSNDSVFSQNEVPPSFPISLEEYAKLAKKHNFTLVFSAEPNSIESVPTIKNHQAMKEVAEKNNVIFLHTHDYLATKTDTGILWWDFVHMTSFGYRLMAEYFFNQLEPVLKKL
jgi:lysophospholipase L1-like esterase